MKKSTLENSGRSLKIWMKSGQIMLYGLWILLTLYFNTKLIFSSLSLSPSIETSNQSKFYRRKKEKKFTRIPINWGRLDLEIAFGIGVMGLAIESQFHVLAVDDSIIDRKLIERLLKTSSYQVTTVDSGTKALEFLGLDGDDPGNPNQPSVSPNIQQEMEVNLIITDYCMPGMTGYDLLKKIKESTYLRNIPVVIMSSENVPSRISRCLEEGAEEFFLKPVRLADVNKLKPHLMKTNHKNQQKQENQEATEAPEVQQQPYNNKRKVREDGLSQDRTRPRYSGLTVV